MQLTLKVVIIMFLMNIKILAVPPLAPINAGAYNPSDSSIRLSFKDTSNNESGFKIYYNGLLIGTTSNKNGIGEYQYITLTNLTAETLYKVQIKSYNNDGESPALIKSFKTLTKPIAVSALAPTQPGDSLSTWGETSTTVRLAFIDNSDNEDGFRIENLNGNIISNLPSSAGAGNYQYATLTGLNSATLYQIKVFAYNSNGDSLASNIKTFRTKPTLISTVEKAFKIQIKTDNEGNSTNTEFEIPTIGTGYLYNVDCNDDGTNEAMDVTENYTCQYNNSGIYTISISGTFPQIYFNNYSNQNASDSKKLLSVVQWGDTEWRSMLRAFMGCINFNGSANDIPNLSKLTSLQRMFFDSSFNEKINDWNLSKVTDTSRMFMSNHSFNQNISDWDMSLVTNTEGMFSHAYSFNQNINDWDTSSFQTIGGMFYDADAFNQNLNQWNVSSVTDMSYMFYDTAIFNAAITNWDVSSVKNMSGMFRNSSAFNQNISAWDISSVENLFYMFNNASAFSNHDLSGWNVLKVSNNTGFSTGWGTGNIEPIW